MEFLDGNDAIREIAPALATDLPAASWCPTDGHANPTKTVHAFAEAARRAGADIREHAPVRELVTEGSRVTGVRLDGETLSAGTVIVAAGVYTLRLLAPLGIELPISITQVPPSRRCRCADAGTGARPGWWRVAHAAAGCRAIPHHPASRSGGRAGHTQDSVQPRLRQVHALAQAAARLVPALADARVNATWAG